MNLRAVLLLFWTQHLMIIARTFLYINIIIDLVVFWYDVILHYFETCLLPPTHSVSPGFLGKHGFRVGYPLRVGSVAVGQTRDPDLYPRNLILPTDKRTKRCIKSIQRCSKYISLR